MALLGTLAIIGLIAAAGVSAASAAGAFGGQRFPRIPPVSRPPPPVRRVQPPTRRDPAIQQAGADTRDLFRRRGRRTTVLTPGRGAGVTGGATATGTRLLLGETAR